MSTIREGTYSVVLVLALQLAYLMHCSAKDYCDGSIGVANEALFPKEMFSAKIGTKPYLARLNHDTIGWCPSNPASGKTHEYIEIDLGEQYKLHGIATQGSGQVNSAQNKPNIVHQRFAKSYKVMYKQHSEAPWKPVRDRKGKDEMIFDGNTDNVSPVRRRFTNISPYPLYARAIRVRPWVYAKDNACLRLELYGCKVSTLDDLQCRGDSDCDDMAKCNKYTFECKCFEKYAGNGIFCADVDECSSGKYKCNKDNGEVCENHGGGYSCGCSDGFVKQGRECKDVDECTTKLDKTTVCGPSNVGGCKNYNGAYRCDCRPGYTSLSHKNRGPCVDIDECKVGTNDCAEIKNSHCHNLNGSALFVCKCNEGFEMVGRTCEATGISAEMTSIAPYLGGIFGLVVFILIPIVAIMLRRWKKIKREGKEVMMASLAPPNAMYMGECESGWFDVDEDLE